jgi:hypothetical protein
MFSSPGKESQPTEQRAAPTASKVEEPVLRSNPKPKEDKKVEDIEFMDDSKIDDLAAKLEADYLASCSFPHRMLYPCFKAGRRTCEIFGCKKAHNAFRESAMDELSKMEED